MKLALKARAIQFAGAALALSIASSAAIAAPITDQGLEIIDGDKRFFDFGCNVTSIPSGTSFSCSDIDVQQLSIATAGAELGLDFNLSGFEAQAGQSLDAAITYRVEVTDPGFQIVGISLTQESTLDGGVGSVAEDASEVGGGGNIVAELDTVNVGPQTNGPEADSATFAGQNELFVRKDIFAIGLIGPQNITRVTQGFQQQANIPEPGTAALLAAGLGGMLLVARRRRARKAGA